jgi:hypothetical protein
VELYLGGRTSLVITRYNQTVNGLIVNVPGADSIRSLQPNPLFFGSLTCAQFRPYCSSQDAAGYGYFPQTQNLNVASVRNQGWELTGNVVAGPITTRGTYSWTKSRSLGVTPAYRKYFDSRIYRQYQPGASFQFLPEHTWALGVTYGRAGTTVALNVTGTGQLANVENAFALRYLDGNIRLKQNQLNLNSGSYVNFNRGYSLADVNAVQRFSPHLEGVLQVQNLTNRYVNDYASIYATLGRQTKAGLRIRM